MKAVYWPRESKRRKKWLSSRLHSIFFSVLRSLSVFAINKQRQVLHKITYFRSKLSNWRYDFLDSFEMLKFSQIMCLICNSQASTNVDLQERPKNESSKLEKTALSLFVDSCYWNRMFMTFVSKKGCTWNTSKVLVSKFYVSVLLVSLKDPDSFSCQVIRLIHCKVIEMACQVLHYHK